MHQSTTFDQLSVVNNENEIRTLLDQDMERTGGIFRLGPAWVGRPGIIVPGLRLKLADIYFSQDLAVNERWLASVTYADNGIYNKVCPEDHGLSYIIIKDKRILLKRAIEICPELLLGSKDKKWDVLPKFFDNRHRIPNHLHPCQDHVREGLVGKPESYHFPRELNINPNDFPITAFGVDPCYTDEQLYAHLRQYFRGDNRATDISNMINLIPGTGWFTPPCTLHAPGSLVTYELQVASDVTCIPESRVNGQIMPPDLIDRDIPVTIEKDGYEKVCEYILKMLRCPNSGNGDNFRAEYFRPPVVIRREHGCQQSYVIYRTGRASETRNPDLYSAKHTEVCSAATLELSEAGAFGAVVLSGHGNLHVPGKEPVPIESVSLFRNRNQIGGDEVFVSAHAAKNLRVHCDSLETLSFYQHFASNTNQDSTTIAIPSYIPFQECYS